MFLNEGGQKHLVRDTKGQLISKEKDGYRAESEKESCVKQDGQITEERDKQRCPVTVLLFAIQLTFCIPYQMLLTTLIRKHMYSYISENDFGPSNQIIVPTGYKIYSVGLQGAATLKS